MVYNGFIGSHMDLNGYQEVILRKLKKKGWNSYLFTDIASVGNDKMIMRGPVSTLEIDQNYLLIPASDEPNNPLKIMSEIDRVYEEKLNGGDLMIDFGTGPVPWDGFTPRMSYIQIRNLFKPLSSYVRFVDALDRITDIS